MLHVYTKIQPQSFLGSEEEDFLMFNMYGHGCHLFNGEKPLEQIVNTLLTENPM